MSRTCQKQAGVTYFFIDSMKMVMLYCICEILALLGKGNVYEKYDETCAFVAVMPCDGTACCSALRCNRCSIHHISIRCISDRREQ